MKKLTKGIVVPLVVGLAASLALMSSPRKTVADATDTTDRAPRCATRLSIAIVGEAASASLLSSPNPQDGTTALLQDPRFVERFSRFINAQFNVTPGATPAEDAPYYLAKYVLQNDKPWSDMFIGGYDIAPSDPNNAGSEATVTTDPDGLGYFRSRAWSVRYAGNESAGIRIVTAYRMMQNTIGLKLSATTNAPDADVSVNGRKSAACAGCHFNPWFALDNTAAVLGTRTGTGNNTQFQPSTKGAQQILGGVTISNDKELVNALVTNEAFAVNAVRLSYKYLFGRDEYSCEGPVFDAAVDAFKKDKVITSALAVIAKDPTFCE